MRERPLACLILLLLIPLTLARVGYEVSRPTAAGLPEVQACRDLTVQARVAERLETAGPACYVLTNVTLYVGEKSIACGALFASALGGEELPAGVVIRCAGQLRDFEGPANPGGFDEWRYYRSRGLECAAQIWHVEIVGGEPDAAGERVRALRVRLGEQLERVLPEREAGLARAMLLGQKGTVESEIRDLYADHGIAHVLAISGLHIQLFGMSLARLMRRAGCRIWVSGLAAGVFICGYGWLCGFPVSCLRAVIMCLLELAGQSLSRTADTMTSAVIAAAAILIVRPMAVIGESFVLSFGAVAGVCLLRPVLRERLPEGLAASCAISLALLPVLLREYGVVSPYSVLLNLIVLPCMSLLMSVLAACLLLSFVWPAGGAFLGGSAGAVFRLYEAACRASDGLPGHLLVRGTPPVLLCLVYYLLLGAAVVILRKASGETMARSRRRRRREAAGALLILAACLMILVRPPHRGLRIVCMDVSQGDGFLIRMDEVNVMIDGGSSDRKEVGDRVIKPALRAEGVDHISFAVITHWDADHMNGILALLEESWLRVDCVVLPAVSEEGGEAEGLRELKNQLTEMSVRWMTVGSGEKLEAGRGALECLLPVRGQRTDNANNASVVLGLHYGAFSMLFTGDLGGERESELLSSPGGYTVLKAMHHGSAYSNTAPMLAWCQPEACVVSCGRDNSYGHPHPEFLKRLAERRIPWYVTAECGAVIVESDGARYRIRGYRAQPAGK